MKRSERLEAITICCGMGDLLNETAKWNIPHFDEWIIVTEPSDIETREVCRKFNLKCLLSDDGKKHAVPNGWNKGRLIDRALHHTATDAWRLHIDCDIALPMSFRHLVQSADLDKSFIFGADRIDVKGWSAWQKLQQSGFMNHSLDYGCRVNFPPGYQIGTRWSHPIHGWLPVGYFQMWHSQEDEFRGVRSKNYPQFHGNAARTDVQFAMMWDRNKRALIPELVTAHLMTEDMKKGINWTGRKTKKFGPGENKGPTSLGSC